MKPAMIFTPAAISTIKAMKLAGATYTEVATAIGSKSAAAVRARCYQLGIVGYERHPDVDPVEHDLGRVGTVIRDAGVYHAMDAGWRHLGWFAEHQEAARAVREHHDLVATA
jgi:hypothetical protein